MICVTVISLTVDCDIYKKHTRSKWGVNILGFVVKNQVSCQYEMRCCSGSTLPARTFTLETKFGDVTVQIKCKRRVK